MVYGMEYGRYLIISPCRNEAEYMRFTLNTVVNQTVPPALWVIVDDGSTDATPEILKEYTTQYDFIKVVTRENRGHRSVGPGVIDAFYSGYQSVDVDQYDFICKLDLDLELPLKYFEVLLKRMADNPRLGTCSGKAYYRDSKTGELVSEKCGDENSVGMTKFYRTTCFKQIGGFVRQVMWDGIDGHKCRMLGWIAKSWDENDLRFIHLRPMGSSQQNLLVGRMRHGFGQYFMGTSLAYMTASALYRMTRPPLIIGGLAMWWGYMKSLLVRKERFDDDEFRRFLRKFQWQCLLHGKRKTTAKCDEKSAIRWDPSKSSAISS